jgi:hypothetical protein
VPDDPGIDSEPRKFHPAAKGLPMKRKRSGIDVVSVRDHDTDTSKAPTICASISGGVDAHASTSSRAIDNSIQTASHASGTCANQPPEAAGTAQAGTIWRELEAIADPRLLAELRNTPLHTLDHMHNSIEHLWMSSAMMLPYITPSYEIYTSDVRYSERELWSALIACGKMSTYASSFPN